MIIAFSYASTLEEECTINGKKYIVYEDQLLKLFDLCPKCGAVTDKKIHENGSMLTVHQSCSNCEHYVTWNSQPLINSIPAGNIALSASILFSGNTPLPMIRFLSHLNCKAISESTFYDHQQQYLLPTINAVWANHKTRLYTQLAGKELRLTGDGKSQLKTDATN